VYKINKNFN